MPPRIFISYRRDDSQSITDRIYERLAEIFGTDEIFRDIQSIPPGTDFRAELESAILDTEIVLVIIGPLWLNLTQQHQDDDEDWGRIAIEMGMRHNKKILPLLVNAVTMPAADDLPPGLNPLAYKKAVNIRNDPDFRSDIVQLSQDIRRLLGSDQSEQQQASTPVNNTHGDILAHDNGEQNLPSLETSTDQKNPVTNRVAIIVAVIGLVGTVGAALIAISPDILTLLNTSPTPTVTPSPTMTATPTETLTPSATPTTFSTPACLPVPISGSIDAVFPSNLPPCSYQDSAAGYLTAAFAAKNGGQRDLALSCFAEVYNLEGIAATQQIVTETRLCNLDLVEFPGDLDSEQYLREYGALSNVASALVFSGQINFGLGRYSQAWTAYNLVLTQYPCAWVPTMNSSLFNASQQAEQGQDSAERRCQPTTGASSP